jgi:hypothetical protein
MQIKNTDKVTLNFFHPTLKQAGQLIAVNNPLTGDWLVKIVVGKDKQEDYRPLASLKGLINSIIRKNKKSGLMAELKIEKDPSPVISH